jgi:hypothetical protein
MADAQAGLVEIFREEYPGGRENCGATVPSPITVIAGLLAPQENSIVPEDPGATALMFATRAVEPVPQFALKTGGATWKVKPRITGDPKVASRSINASAVLLPIRVLHLLPLSVKPRRYLDSAKAESTFLPSSDPLASQLLPFRFFPADTEAAWSRQPSQTEPDPEDVDT